MNKNKTSAFIAKIRKKKGWTQSELAEKLGVTDKAISRWETGKGYPDISLLKSLSETLGISVNEILAGEIIEKEHLREKADTLLIETLSSSHERIIRIIAICLYVFGGLVFFCSIIFNLFPTSYLSLIIISAALCLTFRKRLVIAISAILIGLLLYVGLCELRDYNHVVKYNRPPIYNILWMASNSPNPDGNYKYNKLFYDVYGYNVGMEGEHYEIAPNSSDVIFK